MQGSSRECLTSSGDGLDSGVVKRQRSDMAKNVKILFPHLLSLNTCLYHLSCDQAKPDLDPVLLFTAKWLFTSCLYLGTCALWLSGFPNEGLPSCQGLHPLHMLRPTGLYWDFSSSQSRTFPTIVLTRLFVQGMIWCGLYNVTLVRLTDGIKDARSWGEPLELFDQGSNMGWEWSGYQDVYWGEQYYLWNSKCLTICI